MWLCGNVAVGLCGCGVIGLLYYSIMRIKSHRVCGFTDMVNFRVFFEVMAEPRRAWMKLTPDSDSATPKTYSTHSETPRSETFFLCGCVINC